MGSPQQSIDALLKEDAPEIGMPLPAVAQLQRGFVDPFTGEWSTEVEVRELTGADEEYLASLESKATVTYADYMTALLSRAVVRIGGTEVDSALAKDAVESLTVGDRDILFLAIVKCTYGKEREYHVKCPHCDESNDITIDLDTDFPLQQPSRDLRTPISVTLRNGKTVRLRLPTGADSAYVGKHSTTTATQNTMMLARCVLMSEAERDGISADAWAKGLSLADRSKLIKALLEVKAGPRMEGVNVQCAHCEENMPINLSWMSLLFG